MSALVRQLVQWHAYARRRGLDLDLVILDERAGEAAERLEADLQGGPAGALLGKPGGVFVLAADQAPADDAVLLTAAARAVLGGGRGSLAEQLERPPAAASSRRRRSRLHARSRPRPRRPSPPRRPRACSSGTASAGSRRTAAST